MLNVKQCQYVFKQIQLFFYLFDHLFFRKKLSLRKNAEKGEAFSNAAFNCYI